MGYGAGGTILMDTVTPGIWPEFESDFWPLYRKGSKQRALAEWKKLVQKEREEATNYLPTYVKGRPDKKFWLDAERYLKRRIWLDGADQPEPERKGSGLHEKARSVIENILRRSGGGGTHSG